MNTLELHIREGSEIESRSKRLKAATHEAHDRLDRRIMAGEPFADLERYARFLEVQYRFHHGIDPFYHHRELAAILPDLKSRRRLDLIKTDMRDVGGQPPAMTPRDDYLVDISNALGWLYVAEGSNLGAAFLLKQAPKLGLSESFGARHLAAAPEGRGLHWRTFTAALDQVDLNAEAEERAIEGAKQAFARIRVLVENLLRV